MDNLWEMMRSANTFVSLNRFESCLNVVLGVRACGCPLAVSDIPTYRELLLDERSALFADPHDAAQAGANHGAPCSAARRVRAPRRDDFGRRRGVRRAGPTCG